MTTTVFARNAAINRADANANALAKLTHQGGRRKKTRRKKTRRKKTRRRRSLRGGVAGIVTQYKPMSVPYSENGTNTVGNLQAKIITTGNQQKADAEFDNLGKKT